MVFDVMIPTLRSGQVMIIRDRDKPNHKGQKKAIFGYDGWKRDKKLAGVVEGFDLGHQNWYYMNPKTLSL
jgi:hypothetical protein